MKKILVNFLLLVCFTCASDPVYAGFNLTTGLSGGSEVKRDLGIDVGGCFGKLYVGVKGELMNMQDDGSDEWHYLYNEVNQPSGKSFVRGIGYGVNFGLELGQGFKWKRVVVGGEEKWVRFNRARWRDGVDVMRYGDEISGVYKGALGFYGESRFNGMGDVSPVVRVRYLRYDVTGEVDVENDGFSLEAGVSVRFKREVKW